MALPHLGPDGRDGLHIEGRVGQRLADHIQHQAVIGQEIAVVAVPVQHIGAQQDVQRPGLAGGQHVHGDLSLAVSPLAGGAVDDGAGPYALVGAEVGAWQAGGVHLHPLGQAVAQKAHVRKPAAVHGRGFGLGRQPEIHGRGAVRLCLHREPPGGGVADGVPLAARQFLLEDGGPRFGGGVLLAVEPLPEHPHRARQDQQHHQRHAEDRPAPAAVEDAAAVFLIIGHKTALLSRFYPYYTAPRAPVQRGGA